MNINNQKTHNNSLLKKFPLIPLIPLLITIYVCALPECSTAQIISQDSFSKSIKLSLKHSIEELHGNIFLNRLPEQQKNIEDLMLEHGPTVNNSKIEKLLELDYDELDTAYTELLTAFEKEK